MAQSVHEKPTRLDYGELQVNDSGKAEGAILAGRSGLLDSGNHCNLLAMIYTHDLCRWDSSPTWAKITQEKGGPWCRGCVSCRLGPCQEGTVTQKRYTTWWQTCCPIFSLSPRERERERENERETERERSSIHTYWDSIDIYLIYQFSMKTRWNVNPRGFK